MARASLPVGDGDSVALPKSEETASAAAQKLNYDCSASHYGKGLGVRFAEPQATRPHHIFSRATPLGDSRPYFDLSRGSSVRTHRAETAPITRLA